MTALDNLLNAVAVVAAAAWHRLDPEEFTAPTEAEMDDARDAVHRLVERAAPVLLPQLGIVMAMSVCVVANELRAHGIVDLTHTQQRQLLEKVDEAVCCCPLGGAETKLHS